MALSGRKLACGARKAGTIFVSICAFRARVCCQRACFALAEHVVLAVWTYIAYGVGGARTVLVFTGRALFAGFRLTDKELALTAKFTFGRF